MESKYILVAESGSDITRELAEKYGIVIVPMHVSFGETTLDDGSFPIQKIFDHYETTGSFQKQAHAIQWILKRSLMSFMNGIQRSTSCI